MNWCEIILACPPMNRLQFAEIPVKPELCSFFRGCSNNESGVRDPRALDGKGVENGGKRIGGEKSVASAQNHPADVLVDSFSQGFPAALDISISHALRPSCNLAGVEVGKSASQSAEEKTTMYKSSCAACHWKFIPLCMETTGFVCGEVNSVVGRLSRCLSERSGTSTEEAARFVWSRLGSAIFSSVGANLYNAYASTPEASPPTEWDGF